LFQTWGLASGPVDNVLFERNIGYNNYCQPFHFSTDGYTVQNITIRNNVFDNVAYGAYATAENVGIYNNVFYRINTANAQDAIQVENSTNRVGKNVIIKNNLFIGCGDNSGHGWYNIAAGVAYSADYNYVAKSGSFSSMTGFSEIHGINGGDPKFSNIAGHNFHLTTGSPAIDKGTSISGFGYDKEGILRPKGLAWDIGAYEYVSGSINSIPLSPQMLLVQ
jgi:hypothetical protein